VRIYTWQGSNVGLVLLLTKHYDDCMGSKVRTVVAVALLIRIAVAIAFGGTHALADFEAGVIVGAGFLG
jgi:hypothetical protein